MSTGHHGAAAATPAASSPLAAVFFRISSCTQQEFLGALRPDCSCGIYLKTGRRGKEKKKRKMGVLPGKQQHQLQQHGLHRGDAFTTKPSRNSSSTFHSKETPSIESILR